jgi:hypothetical protein
MKLVPTFVKERIKASIVELCVSTSALQEPKAVLKRSPSPKESLQNLDPAVFLQFSSIALMDSSAIS